MKKIFTTLLMVLGMSATAAFAIPITLVAGDVKFTFDTYATGNTGYPTTTLGTICATGSDCNNVATSSPSPTNFGDDIWGIVSIAAISSLSTGGDYWTRGNGEYLTGLYGGMIDERIDVSSIGFNSFQTTSGTNGGWLNLYFNTSNYDPAIGPLGRTSVDAYTGITGGTLALSADFGGAAIGGLDYSYVGFTNTANLSGNGNGFLDVTGGTLASMLNTNTMVDTKGNAHDLYLEVVYNDSNTVASSLGWKVAGAGTARGQVQQVSEPSSIALMGLGLLGLGAAVRRKTK